MPLVADLLVALAVIGLLALSMVWLLTGRERYAKSRVKPGQRPTTEVLVDPETGRRERVYADPTTGERAYVEEPGPPI